MPGLPVAPDDLGPDVAVVWSRTLAELGPSGVLTGADRDVLRLYCEAVVRSEQSARLLAGSGPLIRGARTGELIKNPLHQITRDNATLVLGLARELGLTPSARSGIRAPAASGAGSRLEAFLREGRVG